MGYLRNCLEFLRETRRDFFHTGAVMPSSRFLGEALSAPLAGSRKPARILEVGAGTGAVTAVIASRLQPGDQFDIVEINAQFVEALRRRMDADDVFRCRREQIHLIHGPIEQINGQARYEVIISCLPLNNFPSSSVRHIFRVFRRLLVPQGTLTFFEYAWIRQMKMPFVGRQERRRLYQVGGVVDSYVRKHQRRQRLVLANMPPAIARQLRF